MKEYFHDAKHDCVMFIALYSLFKLEEVGTAIAVMGIFLAVSFITAGLESFCKSRKDSL